MYGLLRHDDSEAAGLNPDTIAAAFMYRIPCATCSSAGDSYFQLNMLGLHKFDDSEAAGLNPDTIATAFMRRIPAPLVQAQGILTFN